MQLFRKINPYTFSSKKIVNDPLAILKQIPEGARVLTGGFGICGIPENLLLHLSEIGTKNLTIVSNTASIDDWGLGLLFKNKQVKRMIGSYVGENHEFERQYLNGELEVELIPSGTFSEKLRAAGAGIPGFYTGTGIATFIENGGMPIKYSKNGSVEILSSPKECKVFNNKKHMFVKALSGDFALIKAKKADTKGNLVFSKSARNFNTDMVGAAKVCIAEVEEIVEAGEIDPDQVHVPGIFVNYIYQAQPSKKFEKIVYDTDYQPNTKKLSKHKASIAKRVAEEVKDGMYVNLGIGIPSLVPHYVSKDYSFELQTENGVLGVGDYPQKGQEDPDLTNAGKETITYNQGAAFFGGSTSFGIIRGHHLDLTILGTMEISRKGDVANWIIPNQKLKGMGGAMDLVSCGCRVAVATLHTVGGKSKLVEACTLPITGEQIVDIVVTEKAVFERGENGLVLTEIANNATLDDIRANTGFKIELAGKVSVF